MSLRFLIVVSIFCCIPIDANGLLRVFFITDSDSSIDIQYGPIQDTIEQYQLKMYTMPMSVEQSNADIIIQDNSNHQTKLIRQLSLNRGEFVNETLSINDYTVSIATLFECQPNFYGEHCEIFTNRFYSPFDIILIILIAILLIAPFVIIITLIIRSKSSTKIPFNINIDHTILTLFPFSNPIQFSNVPVVPSSQIPSIHYNIV